MSYLYSIYLFIYLLYSIHLSIYPLLAGKSDVIFIKEKKKSCCFYYHDDIIYSFIYLWLNSYVLDEKLIKENKHLREESNREIKRLREELGVSSILYIYEWNLVFVF